MAQNLDELVATITQIQDESETMMTRMAMQIQRLKREKDEALCEKDETYEDL